MIDLELMRRLQSLGVKLWLEGDAVKFSAPRDVMTPELRSHLRAHKDDIRLFLRRAGAGDTGPGEEPIAVVPRGAGLPLSFAQQRLWFLDRLQPGTATYAIAAALAFTGALDIDVLGRAFADVVRRHEILRTTYVDQGGMPAQIIHPPPATFPLPVTDLSGLSPSSHAAEVRRRALEEASYPFDLAEGPVLRAALLRLGAEEHVLLATIHHIGSDGWSMGVLVRELSAAYAAFLTDKPSPLPDLPLQYADFAGWQRQRLAGPRLEQQLTYWKTQLAGASALELPTDCPRPPVQTFRGGREPLTLSPELGEAVRALCREHAVTPFMLLLSVLQVLLHRYTGQHDICAGTPVANRGRKELEPLIGFFVNTLVLRADVSDDPPFTRLLSRTREAALGALAHQELPFERLVDALGVERDLSRNPLFQVMFVLQHRLAEPPPLPGLTVRALDIQPDVAKVDLSLSLFEAAESYAGAIEYNADLFLPETIRRMAGHFEALLRSIAAAPSERISALPLLSPPERHTLLAEWGGAATTLPPDECAHDLFEAQVEKSPDAVAVVSAGERVTYRELNRRANRLAHHLRTLGVGPDVLAGICLRRSAHLIVAVLAVHKAGGAFVPLDPTYPTDRLATMLDDARPAVLLTEAPLLGVLPAHDAPVVCLDAAGMPLAQAPEHNLTRAATPRSLAYVVHTSGSTGKPRGVLIEHSGLCNVARAQQRIFDVHPGTRFLQFVRFGFDVSIGEVYTTLGVGAALHLGPDDPLLPGEALARLIRDQQIHVLNVPPAVLASLPSEPFDSIRTVITGAEACPLEVIARWAREHRFLNAYGPTEASITATYAECRAEGGKPPIGRPLENVRVYVLDEHLQLVPAGIPGELCIGGAGVARGYLGRPELTAQQFVPDPFRDAPGARMYRTGDRARWLPDGNLEFLGRADDQVKLRGFRIEPGDIESALQAHPAVHRVVVLLREDTPGDKRLVAYIVGGAAGAPPASELRTHLEQRLPWYMVPAAFVALDKLPLSPNGKVDRKALPPPDPVHARTAASPVLPRTPVEELLAGIWGDLLKLDRVGVHDHFFALGGHSLLATQVASRIRSAIGVELPVRRLFEAPVLSQLAAAVEQARREQAGVAAAPIERAPRGGPLPLSFAQQRLWLLDQIEPGNSAYNVSVALRLTGTLDVEALRSALAQIVRRHEILRTTFPAHKERPVQIIHAPSLPELRVEDLSSLPEAQRTDAARQHACRAALEPFDLARGPLLRAALLRLAPDEHILLAAMHHIVCDGWSLGILVRELGVLYAACCTHAPAPLPDLPIQYADFAAWQWQHGSGQALQAQLAYWRDRLAGAPALELPTDHPRPPVQTFRGGSQAMALATDLTAALEQLSKAQGATLFMTLFAAFLVLLHRYCRQDDLCIGTSLANRSRVELEPLIGFFVSTPVLRVDLSGNPTFEELIGRVREVALGAYAHQDLPFERLVEALGVERDLSRNPLFQVTFMLQNAPVEPLVLEGLRIEPLPVDVCISKFDLELSLAKEAGELHGALLYNADLFEPATIQRMAGHFEALLRAAARAPAQRIGALPMLTGAERRQVIEEWNDSRVPPAELIHDLIDRQAARAPLAIALASGGRRLTYGELNRRANQLAHRLRALGVGPDVLAGVYTTRSFEMVIALLGVLKAGGAYFPLDPTYPRERLLFMLQDAGVQILLAEQPLADALSPPVRHILCLDTAWPDLQAERDTTLSSGVRSDNLIYVISTSGSTGKPKSVENQHGGVANLIRWVVTEFHIRPEDHLVHRAALGFDASSLELWPGLAAGACVHLADDESGLSVPAFAHFCAREGITVAHIPPILAEPLVEQDLPAGFALRTLMTGSDKVQRSPRRAPPFRFVNFYGPTETSVLATWSPIHPSDSAAPPPIGRPLPGVRVYLTGAHFEPVPAGVPGELLIGGTAVGRGYLGRPDLTAERFVPDPFGPDPGARLYRTGDLARYRPDGQIEFLGRIDHQAKVRGYRIELGEIEAVLQAHEAVRQAVAVVREDVPGDKRVVAYVVPRDQTASAADLRKHLQQALPDYMVPSAFVLLDELPVTPNGKVDRKALPRPGEIDPGEPFVAPRSAEEELIAGIWCDVLGLSRAGIHDDFFALGGHSLAATQVVSRLHEALSVELPLRALFEAPTVAGLAARVARTSRGEAPPIPTVPRGGDLPLSFAQQRLWFLDQLDPNSSAYNVPAALRVRGDLDLVPLQRALTELVRRHETLRTTFAARRGEPVQLIHPPPPSWPLLAVDLSSLPDTERAEQVRERCQQEATRPFELAAGPLLRAMLLKLAQDDHVLILTMHHIVSDGWSLGVLVRELSVLYAAFRNGQPSPLHELHVQYADVASWQRQWLTGERLEAELCYWRERLDGAPVLELPTDRPRSLLTSRRAGQLAATIPADVTRALQQLSRRCGATLFMTLLAGFQLLLSRHAGQDDICVGTPVAGRTRIETEPLIGFFVNTLVLRADLSGNPSFVELLRRVRRAALEAYAHQNLPFERLVDALKVDRTLGRHPLFQVMFALQNAPLQPVDLPGVALSPLPVEAAAAKFDLTFTLSETAGELRAALEYDAGLFDAGTIARMVDRFDVLLRSVAEAPDRPIGELSILPEAERHLILTEWNAPVTFPREATLHGLFEAQAERTPEAIAACFGDETLSYAELDRRANRLAWRLLSLGVSPSIRVGLCLERSLQMLTAIVGILKAGACYVPLDPDYPRERLAFLLEDAAAPVLVTTSALRPRLPSHDTRVVCLDDPEPAGGFPDTNPGARCLPGDLAYVIYTSGSTGTPKGIRVSHANVVRLFGATRAWFHFDHRDVWTLFHSCAFDFSVWEIWGALLHGGRLVVVPYAVSRSPAELHELLRRERVTVLNQTPSAFRGLIQANLAASAGPPLSLRHVIFGGEALDPEALRPWLDAHGDESPALINMYGITETTVHVTYRRIRKADLDPARGSVIGRPIPDLTLYILDPHGHPAPIGVPGEIHVGGAGVADGYLGRPDLTALRFVPDAFGVVPGSRLYRSGDLGRLRSDGGVEYLGRIDQQVKLRGFRIELAEIELALKAHPAVGDAVVLLRQDTPGDSRLVAYVVPRGADEPATGLLREHLQEKLPAYMVPSAFVPIGAVPLTPHGKLDRAALPAPDTLRKTLDRSFVAPRNRVELDLAAIWEDLIGIRPIGVRDDFFALGGHSLLAVRLLAQIEERFATRLPLSRLFQGATIEALADALSAGPAQRSGSPLIALQPNGSKPPLFCVHAVGGSALAYRDLALHLGEDQPFHALHAQGVDSDEPPYNRVEALAARYVEAIREAQPEGPYSLSGWSFGGLVAFEMAQQLVQAGERIRVLVLLDTTCPGFAPSPPIGDAVVLHLFSRELGLPLPIDELLALSPDEGMRRVAELATTAGVLPPAVGEAYVRRLLGVHRAHIEAEQLYVPGAYPGPIDLVRPAQAPSEQAAVILTADPTAGWARLTPEPVTVHLVPGDHFTMVRPPHVATLAEVLGRILGR